MARFLTANDIINRAAIEVGLLPASDPVASGDDLFVQLTGLLNSAGQEFVEMNDWQALTNAYEVTTVEDDTGVYDLPDDFSYMIDQTGWDRTNRVPIGGPLSPQDWSYLDGRDLVSSTIYASFRLVDNKFDLFPQPPPIGLEVRFEYISRDWVRENTSTGAPKDTVTIGSDVVLYEPTLIIKFLKVKFLDAKGFDSTAARLEFDTLFSSRVGKDVGASILSASGGGRGLHLIDGSNAPDSGYKGNNFYGY
jgi:hypothetical protein